MKKVISVLAAVLMTFILLLDNCSISKNNLVHADSGTIIATGKCGANGDNLTWTLDEEGLLTISGKGDMEDWLKIGGPSIQETNAPWHNYNDSIQSIIVDKGVTSVGDWAFAFCLKLKSAIIYDDVTRIGRYAFCDCCRLEYVVAGDNITDVDDTIFAEMTVYKVEVDPLILGDDNSKLSEVYNDFFCPVVHSTDVTIVDSGEFGITGNNLTWSLFSDGILEIDGKGEMPQYRNMNELPPWYDYREDVKTVIIKEGVTNTGAAFYNHTSLRLVSIPESVKEIQYAAFSECSKLRHTFVPTENIYDLKLNGIVIPNGVTALGDSAFYNCSDIKSIDIPDSVVSLDSNVFQNCESLVSITIPESITIIPGKAFYGCRKLESVTLPNSITGIGTSAFTLTSCSHTDGQLSYVDNWVVNCSSSAEDVVIKDGTVGIASSAFSNYTDLKSITIPDSVKYIGSGAFRSCVSLTSIKIPDGVTTIENSVFQNCNNLTSVTLPNNTASIGDRAFYDCSNLTEITIPNSVSSIGDYTFYNCLKLTEITIPSSVTSIGEYAFEYCSNLTEITIPDSVTNIGGRAFKGTSWLENKQSETSLVIVNNILVDGSKCSGDVIIPDSITSITPYAFADGIYLTSITIPDRITSIASNAFVECRSLTSIIIPDSVTSIEDSAFQGCLSLKTINIPESVTSIGDYAFYHCSRLESITIPNHVTSIGKCAFEYCPQLTEITILNPNCEIYDYAYTISSNYYLPVSTAYYDGIILGYDNSTAQAYAEKYGYTFESLGGAHDKDRIYGDCNNDGKFTVADIVMLQKWLLGAGNLTNWQNADLCEDGVIDVFDLVMMRRKLIYG